MGELAETLVTGVLIGAVFSLFISGRTSIFGVTRVVNFAHGDFVTIGMYGVLIAYNALHIPIYLSIPIVFIAAFALGLLVYRVLISRTFKYRQTSSEREQSQMVMTLAVSILIANAILAIAGPNPQSVHTLQRVLRFDSVTVPVSQLVAFGCAVLAFALLYIVTKYSRFGRAVAATVDDREMAAVYGVNTGRVFAIAFGIGIALAGLAGAVLATYYTITPTAGETFLVISFITVILGGLGNVAGTAAAGFIVAVVQQVTASYINLDLQNAGIYIVFIALLTIRPSGLFPSRNVEEAT
jgi:branched-chain amino acid transport system permease protein